MNGRKWPVVALALLFFGPFILAVVLYAGRGAMGGFGLIENPDRELIAEPVALPLEPLQLADGSESDPGWARSRWLLIYARLSPCEGDCQPALTRLYQVYLALGHERDRVRKAFLVAAGGNPPTLPPGFLHGMLDATAEPGLIELLGRDRLEQGRYFVVDPLGNVILSYPDTADQERLLHDLELLLDASRIG